MRSNFALREIIDTVIDYRGKTPKKLGSDWSKSGYKVLSAKNIKTGKIVQPETIRYADDELYIRWMKEEIQKGDILITSEAPFGEVFYWSSDEKIVLSQRLFGLRSKKAYNSRYLYYYMTSEKFQAELDSRATGTTVRGLRQPELLKCEVEIPSYAEQLSIAATLSCIDDKIELNNRINDNLLQMAQAIFKSWFVDFEPFQDGEFEDSELGMIPKGWGVGSLGDISSISSGKRPRIKEITASSEISIPVIGASSIMAYTNESLYEEPILVTGRVGTHGVVQRFSKKCWPSDNTLVIKSKYYEFVDHCLKGVDFNSINRGSTQPLITQTDLKNIRIIKPLEDVLLTFESLISNLMVLWEENNRLNKTLSETRDTLLPKLMSGEIRVPVEEV
jgi:type I restriction enzyme S subunit